MYTIITAHEPIQRPISGHQACSPLEAIRHPPSIQSYHACHMHVGISSAYNDLRRFPSPILANDVFNKS